MNMIRGKKIYVHDYLKEYQRAKEQTNKENASSASVSNNPLIVGKRKLNATEISTKNYDNTVNENLGAKKLKLGENVDSSLLQKNVITNSDEMLRQNSSLLFSSISQPSNWSASTSTSTTHSSLEANRGNRTKVATFTSNISNLDQKQSDKAPKLIQSKEISTLNTTTAKKFEDVKKPKNTDERVDSSLLQKNAITNSDKMLRKGSSLLFSSMSQPSISSTSTSTTQSSKEVERQNRTKFATFTSKIPKYVGQKQSDKASKQSKETSTLNTGTTKKIVDVKKTKMSESVDSSLLQKNVITNSDETLNEISSLELWFDSIPIPSSSTWSTSTTSTTHSSKGVDGQNRTKFATFTSNTSNLDQKQSDNGSKAISAQNIATTKKIEEKKREPTFEEWMNSILTPNILSPNTAPKPGTSRKTSGNTETTKSNETTFEQFMNAMLSPDIPNWGRRKFDRASKPKYSREISTQTSFGDSILELLTPSSSQNKLSQTSSTQTKTDETPGHSDMDLTQTFSQMSNRSESFATRSFSNQEAMRHQLPYFDTSVVSHTREASFQLSQASSTQRSVQPSQINSENGVNFTNEDLNILQVLGNDVTLSPQNKFQFNNIAKIGTEKWLQFAQTAALKHKEKLQRAEVETVHVSFEDVYDYSVKHKVRCYREGNIRIYKLEINVKSDDEDTFTPNLSFEDLEESSQGQRNLRMGMDEILKDKNLICTEQAPRINKDKIKSMINDIFVKLYSIYENGKIPRFGVLCKYNHAHCIFVDGRLKLNPSLKMKRPEKRIRYNLYLTFCRMLFLLGKIYSLLETNKQLTKREWDHTSQSFHSNCLTSLYFLNNEFLRELFYQIKHLVKSQSQVNTALQMVSMLLNVGQWHLNITSNSGLVYGNLKLVWSSGEVTNCNVPATMIPCNADDIVEFHTNAYFILVIEKESIFQKLLQEDLPNKLARPFILITGKGYPSVNTQLFIKKLSTVMALPVFILVDGDVYGIRIMLQYRFGSCTNCYLSEYLAIPNARWLGVLPSEINTLGIKNLPLTNREKGNINSLLKYPFMESQPRIAEEVKFLLNNNKKASIEGLIKNDNFLSGFYLPSKLNNGEFL